MNILELADAIVEELNASAFPEDSRAERVYQLPEASENQDLDHYDTLRLFVVPAGVKQSVATRESTYDDVVVHVGVMKRIAGETRIDPLVALAAEISDHFRFLHFVLEGKPRAEWQGSEIDPLFDQANLTTRKLFVSVVALTYRVRRGV